MEDRQYDTPSGLIGFVSRVHLCLSLSLSGWTGSRMTMKLTIFVYSRRMFQTVRRGRIPFCLIRVGTHSWSLTNRVTKNHRKGIGAPQSRKVTCLFMSLGFPSCVMFPCENVYRFWEDTRYRRRVYETGSRRGWRVETVEVETAEVNHFSGQKQTQGEGQDPRPVTEVYHSTPVIPWIK